jgi:hypothetical protein
VTQAILLSVWLLTWHAAAPIVTTGAGPKFTPLMVISVPPDAAPPAGMTPETTGAL